MIRLLLVAGVLIAGQSAVAQEKDAVKILKTPSGLRFGIFGKKGEKPAPTLFVFASSIEETLGSTYYNKPGRLLGRDGAISVSLDIPCHGLDKMAGEPAGLTGWRARLGKDDDFVAPFNKKASEVLDYLIKEGWTAPDKVAACGTSRGGFIALHWAASEPRVGAVAAFAPVTELLALAEFRGMEKNAATKSRSLIHQAGKLAGRPTWICIGNNDQRVGTDHIIALARKIVAASAANKVAPVDLHVMPTLGHSIHASAHDEAAAWITGQWRKPGK